VTKEKRRTRPVDAAQEIDSLPLNVVTWDGEPVTWDGEYVVWPES
jgi:hypothetical protein